MRLLALVFACSALYGLATAHYGGSALSLLFAGFVLYARGKFDEQDQAWLNDPKRVQPADIDTTQQLIDKECEASGSRF